MRKKNCLSGRSLTMSVAQSTLVATTSLLPPLKVPCTNGVVRLCKFACRSMRRRRGNHGQSICVAGRCAVLPRFSEHWRRWHRSDLRQRRTARATTFVSSGVRRRNFWAAGAFVILSALYGLRPAHRSLVSSDSPDHDQENNCTVSRRLRKAACISTTINKHTTCEVHHLAFHTCLFPRFPVLQFGAAFSSLAFSVPPPYKTGSGAGVQQEPMGASMVRLTW